MKEANLAESISRVPTELMRKATQKSLRYGSRRGKGLEMWGKKGPGSIPTGLGERVE